MPTLPRESRLKFSSVSSPHIILGAIGELYDEGAPIDLQIITQRLREQGNQMPAKRDPRHSPQNPAGFFRRGPRAQIVAA
jgi:hypothetical protein